METISEAIRQCRDDGARSAMMMIAENQTQIPRYRNHTKTKPQLGCVCLERDGFRSRRTGVVVVQVETRARALVRFMFRLVCAVI